MGVSAKVLIAVVVFAGLVTGGTVQAVTLNQVTTESSYDAEPATSPNGSQIAFISNRLGFPSVFVVDLSGGSAYQVTSETSFGSDPTWTSDGLTLGFASDRNGTLDIWTADSSSLESNLVQVTSETGSEYSPAFSPIDNSLLFVSDNLGLPAVFLIPDGTTTVTQVTSETFYSADPAFSIDANTIVFAAKKGTTYDLYTIATGGALGSETQLTSDASTDELEPQYSADGNTVYFTRRTWVNESDYTDEVYSVPASGGAISAFISDSGVINNGDPSPSPVNPNVLAFASDSAGNMDVWTVIDPAVITQSPTVIKRWHRPATAAIPYATAAIDINIANAYNLGAFEFKSNYNKNVVVVRQASHVKLGSFLGSTGNTAIPIGPTINNASGQTSYAAFSFGANPGPNGGGLIAKMIFSTTHVHQVSTTNITLSDVQITNVPGNSQPVSATTVVQFTVCHFADRDCDNDVDVVDIQLVAGLWNNPGAYNPDRDVDGDGDIDIVDIQLVAGRWNTFAPLASAAPAQLFRYGAATSPVLDSVFGFNTLFEQPAFRLGCLINDVKINERVEG